MAGGGRLLVCRSTRQAQCARSRSRRRLVAGVYEWWHDGDEWCTYTGEAVQTFSEMKPWLDVDDIMSTDEVAGKEHKTFLLPLIARSVPFERPDPRKGKGKGGSKSKKGSPQSQALATFPGASKGKGVGNQEGGQRPGAVGYLGCFICGDKSHDWRRCPRRGASTASSGSSGKPICFIDEGEYMTSEAAQSSEPDPRASSACVYMTSEAAQSSDPDPR